MEVILLERIHKLGIMGQVVRVKPGYARNFLLRQKKALRATAENIEFFQAQKSTLEADNLHRKQEATDVASRMENLVISLIRQASESGHLYGSVNARDVAEALLEKGFKIQRHQVSLGKPVKELGVHPAYVVLHPEVTVTVMLNIAQSNEEAQKQQQSLEKAQKKTEEVEAVAS